MNSAWSYKYNKILFLDWSRQKREEIIEINKDDLFDVIQNLDKDFFEYLPLEIIEESVNKYIDKINFCKYLNNLHINILSVRLQEKDWERMKDFYDVQNKIKYWDLIDDYYKIVWSEKKLKQTPIEFQEECDNAIIACWIEPDQLTKEYREIRRKLQSDNLKHRINEEERNDSFEDELNNYRKKLAKIYIYLRKQWYTNSDLIV